MIKKVTVVYLATLFALGLILPSLSYCTTVANKATPNAQPSLDITIDPRIELISIIFRLAGNPEYNNCPISTYSKEVDTYFSPFKEHLAVRLAAQLRNTRHISFDAPMSLAVHLTDAYSLKLRSSSSPAWLAANTRWQSQDIEPFLTQIRAFEKASHFREFINSHQSLYEKPAREGTGTILDSLHPEWFAKFFGYTPDLHYHVIISLLNGPNNYGPKFKEHNREDIYCIIGTGLTRDGRVFLPGIDIVIHEFTHSYTNPIVDRHLRELEPAGKHLFASQSKQMAAQHYGKWQSIMYESLVRASVLRHAQRYSSWSVVLLLRAELRLTGFYWVLPLTDLLGEYETQRGKYPDLDAFMPRIADFFNDYARTHPVPGKLDRLLAWLYLVIAIIFQPFISFFLLLFLLIFVALLIRRRRKRAVKAANYIITE
jgi:hypothetical protein